MEMIEFQALAVKNRATTRYAISAILSLIMTGNSFQKGWIGSKLFSNSR
jgi:hypothetical protein